jgi:putative tryptophan/tyrosine transport system substrate-binding protein
MRRRDFITLLGSAVASWSLAAYSQQPAMPVIGYLGLETPERYASRLQAFREGLGSTGFEEGRNVTIEFRWAGGHYDLLPTLAEDLVSHHVSVIAAPGGVPGALAAKAATSTIPIVFEMGPDPIALGLVVNLNHPGGNITGATSQNAEVNPKRLELLHEVMPNAAKFGLLVNPTNPTNAQASVKLMKRTADAIGLRLEIFEAGTEHDFDRVFAEMATQRVAGLVISNDTFYATRNEQLAAASVRYAVPAVHQSRDFPAAGGLMSYGGSFAETHRQAGVYVGRILKGEKPGDLPVVLSTKVELFINLKTAKMLGLTIPLSLLGRADGVIE